MPQLPGSRVDHVQRLSESLEIVRLRAHEGCAFSVYKPGQHIALTRERCKITRKIVDARGRSKYLYEFDEQGGVKRGTVTRSYSIASAPFETSEKGCLEVYVALEIIDNGVSGRVAESLFNIDRDDDNRILFSQRAEGTFTLEDRRADSPDVIMVGSGSGLAPFVSMLKQLDYDAQGGKKSRGRYTLFHGNRTFHELGYHADLLAIEKSGTIDFVYVPAVSRPSSAESSHPEVGMGRVNNVLRLVFGMPMKGDESRRAIRGAHSAKRDGEKRGGIVQPVLPKNCSSENLLARMNPRTSVIFACGNDNMTADVRSIAGHKGIRFEKEEW